jgi:mannan endo-1,4-beta-mannosidase
LSDLTSNPGGETGDWGNAWITNHAAACVAASKPCVLEEYSTPSDQVAVESQWQSTSLSSTGMAGDMFWQWGDTISTARTANDEYTIYYFCRDHDCNSHVHIHIHTCCW